MSNAASGGGAPPPARYAGRDKYVRVARDFLGVRLTHQQRRILRAVAANKRVVVQSANGVGKSFTAAALNGAFLLRHPGSICIPTSGSYGVLEDVLWKPLRRLWAENDLPGRTLQSPPRIELGHDEEWYMRAASPKHAGNLEGRHAEHLLVTIEEADKPDISRQHIDSAESLLTGPGGRLVVIANPPHDESNLVADLRESERWCDIQFSALDSHNVRVDAGESDAERIPGLVGLETIRGDWESWNDEPWPGLDAAREQSRERDDLDTRWYRRRAGRMPPDDADRWRPWSGGDVEAAFARSPDHRPTPEALGVDVARRVDQTVAIGLHDDVAVVERKTQAPHPEQRRWFVEQLQNWPQIPVAVDAIGKGEPLAEELADRFPDVRRFEANATPEDDSEYRTKWARGLALVGEWLRGGGAFNDDRLYEELRVAARTVEFSERHLSSRGTVIEATAKDAIKDDLGRSPDHLDALLMALTASETDATAAKASPTFSW